MLKNKIMLLILMVLVMVLLLMIMMWEIKVGEGRQAIGDTGLCRGK